MGSLKAAYILYGVLIVGYVIKLLVNQWALKRELSSLKSRLDKSVPG